MKIGQLEKERGNERIEIDCPFGIWSGLADISREMREID